MSNPTLRQQLLRRQRTATRGFTYLVGAIAGAILVTIPLAIWGTFWAGVLYLIYLAIKALGGF